MTMPRPIIGFIAILLAGCTTHADLHYRPSEYFNAAPAPQPLIAGVVVADHRTESANRLATEIPTIGNPLVLVGSMGGSLETGLPVHDEVAQVFGEALVMRNELLPTAAAPLVLEVDLYKFDADHYMNSQARIDMAIALRDRRTNQVIYRDRIASQEKFMQLLGSNIHELQGMAEHVLDSAVDRLLAKPGFCAIVMPAAGPAGLPPSPPPYGGSPYSGSPAWPSPDAALPAYRPATPLLPAD